MMTYDAGRGPAARQNAVGLAREAQQRFERARAAARLRWLGSALHGRAPALLTREALLAGATPLSQPPSDVQHIPLAWIVGSESRAHEFDRAFAPLSDRSQTRWQSVAIAWLAGELLPPVRLIQIDDRFLVRDGHHRISVAQAFGATTIEAIVEQRFVGRRCRTASATN